MKKILWVSAYIILLFFAYVGEFGKALLLSFSAISIDWLSQIWRFRMFKKYGTSKLLNIILGGFLLRISGILFFARLGWIWLSPLYFKVFICSLVTLPIFNLFSANHFKQGS